MSREGFLLLLVLLGALEARQCVVHAVTSSFTIKEGGFSCGTGGNLLCTRDASTTTTGELKLIPDPPDKMIYTFYEHTVGVALYEEPIQLLNLTTKNVASFNISFSFRIEAAQAGPGDGMAFVMFSDPDWIGDAGRAFGAFQDDGTAGVTTLAVEFDTFLNTRIDTDNNHVGIDIESINSVLRKSLTFKLWAVDRVYAWVDYDSPTSTLEVRVSDSPLKPELALLRYSRSLLEVFKQEEVWVGFSGSNGICPCYDIYTVNDLSCVTSFLSLRPPTPAPASLPAVNNRLQQTTNSNSTTVTRKNSTVSVGLTAGLTAGIAALVVGTCAFGWCLLNRRKKGVAQTAAAGGHGETAAEEEFQIAGHSHSMKIFSYSELCAATKNFDDDLKLGEGGFGNVYRGEIPGSEQLVAVKKVSSDSKQGEREFMAGVSTISQLRHRNIVELLGWCCDGPGNYLLVYEYMPNGSLHDALFSSRSLTNGVVLTWEKRFKILGGLAAALQHLHEGWRQQVIHRDVKSSNIIFDDHFNAKLGHFGLARVSGYPQNPVTTAIAGTYGYMAPEASLTGKYTVETDVFAFGAVALEIVCGRKVYDANYPADEILLVDWVWEKLSEDDLFSVVDIRLQGKCDLQQVEVVLLLGLSCSHPKPAERPAMNRVLEILSGSVEMPLISRSKPKDEDLWKLYRHRVGDSPRSQNSSKETRSEGSAGFSVSRQQRVIEEI